MFRTLHLHMVTGTLRRRSSTTQRLVNRTSVIFLTYTLLVHHLFANVCFNFDSVLLKRETPHINIERGCAQPPDWKPIINITKCYDNLNSF